MPLPVSWPVCLHVAAAHQQHRVAVDELTGGVHQDRAIAVAVEGHAEPAPPLDDDARQVLRVGRAAVQVDVAAVRRGAQDLNVEAQLAEQPRRHSRGRAVRGVDRDLHPSEPLRIRQRQARVRDIGVDDVGAFDRHVRGAADLPARVGDDRFHLALERLGELLAAPGEHLDAVVLEWIVRRRDHDSRVEAHLAGDVGDGGCRQHAGAGDRGAFGPYSTRELALDPFPGFARVAPQDESKLAAVAAHRPDQRRAQPRHGFMIEGKLSRLAANTISTEKPLCHGLRRHIWRKAGVVSGADAVLPRSRTPILASMAYLATPRGYLIARTWTVTSTGVTSWTPNCWDGSNWTRRL